MLGPEDEVRRSPRARAGAPGRRRPRAGPRRRRRRGAGHLAGPDGTRVACPSGRRAARARRPRPGRSTAPAGSTTRSSVSWRPSRRSAPRRSSAPRLYQAERESRRSTEALQAATAALAAAVTAARVGEAIVREALRAFGATSASLRLLDADGGALETIAWGGFPDALARPLGSAPVDGPSPTADALRERRPLFLGARADVEARYPGSTPRTRGPGGRRSRRCPLEAEERASACWGCASTRRGPSRTRTARPWRPSRGSPPSRWRGPAARGRAAPGDGLRPPRGGELRPRRGPRGVGAAAAARGAARAAPRRRVLHRARDGGRVGRGRGRVGAHARARVARAGDPRALRDRRRPRPRHAARHAVGGVAARARRVAGRPGALRGRGRPGSRSPPSGCDAPGRGRSSSCRSSPAGAASARSASRRAVRAAPTTSRTSAPRGHRPAGRARARQRPALRGAARRRAHAPAEPAPPRLPLLRDLSLAARYLSAAVHTEASGDWYEAVELPGERVFLAVGDVVGRGTEAAAVMGQLRSATRAYALAGMSPAGALEQLSDFAAGVPGAEVSTAAAVEIDLARGRLTYACAGHPPPLSSAAARGPAPRRGSRAGARRGRGGYREDAVPFEEGSALVLYTDGLVERRGEPLDAGLGAARGRGGGRVARPRVRALRPARRRARGPAIGRRRRRGARRHARGAGRPARPVRARRPAALGEVRQAVREWLVARGGRPGDARGRAARVRRGPRQRRRARLRRPRGRDGRGRAVPRGRPHPSTCACATRASGARPARTPACAGAGSS